MVHRTVYFLFLTMQRLDTYHKILYICILYNLLNQLFYVLYKF